MNLYELDNKLREYGLRLFDHGDGAQILPTFKDGEILTTSVMFVLKPTEVPDAETVMGIAVPYEYRKKHDYNFPEDLPGKIADRFGKVNKLILSGEALPPMECWERIDEIISGNFTERMSVEEVNVRMAIKLLKGTGLRITGFAAHPMTVCKLVNSMYVARNVSVVKEPSSIDMMKKFYPITIADIPITESADEPEQP